MSSSPVTKSKPFARPSNERCYAPGTRRRWMSTRARLGLALAAIDPARLATELTLWWRQPTSVLKTMGRGMYGVRDGRVSLKPGFRTHFDDGSAHGDIAISSLGYRGHEPRADGRDRVVPGGDSFALGELMGGRGRIDAVVERA